ncbi:hypothetical protein D3C86_2105790 [compost metagenome]
MPNGQKKANHTSIGEIDFLGLASQLKELDFVSDIQRWQKPTLDEHRVAVDKASLAEGEALHRRAVE